MHGTGVLGASRSQRGFRFEGHTTGRASARFVFVDLGTHGADVGYVLGCSRWILLPMSVRYCCWSRGTERDQIRLSDWSSREIFCGVGFELVGASGTTEVVILLLVIADVFGGGRVDIHAADRVTFAGG